MVFRIFRLFLISLTAILTVMPSWPAHATVQIPQNLTKANRQEITRIIGFGTANKILSDPYPLGGYSGFEIGLQMENIPLDEMSRMGSRIANAQDDATFSGISAGKGLFENIDVFLNFTPYSQGTDISQYGALVRWGFFQASSLPLSASILAYSGSTNVGNQVVTLTSGLDLIGGINVNSVALFGGGGPMTSNGRFDGGPNGVTDSKSFETENVSGFHAVLGVSVRITQFFLIAQIDRYTQSVYSGKLGMRF
jgi:hypothetical protein